MSKPERVRARIADACGYHFYCRQLWHNRMENGPWVYGANVERLSSIANHQDKTYDRIDDIAFGHPFGISIA